MKAGRSVFAAWVMIVIFSGCAVAESRNPDAAELEQVVKEAYAKFRDVADGKPADYIPELARVDPDKFGVVIVTAAGTVYEAEAGSGAGIARTGRCVAVNPARG